MKIETECCNRDVRTYGDVIRHMTNGELALFLEEIRADTEREMLAITRAKMHPHRVFAAIGPGHEKFEWHEYFMERRIKEEPENYGDAWGIENWQDLMQWESGLKKNFGMDTIY